MPFGRFVIFTFAGSFFWSFALAAIGFQWGPQWEQFRERARFLDYPIAALVLVLVAWYFGTSCATSVVSRASSPPVGGVKEASRRHA